MNCTFARVSCYLILFSFGERYFNLSEFFLRVGSSSSLPYLFLFIYMRVIYTPNLEFKIAISGREREQRGSTREQQGAVRAQGSKSSCEEGYSTKASDLAAPYPVKADFVRWYQSPVSTARPSTFTSIFLFRTWTQP